MPSHCRLSCQRCACVIARSVFLFSCFLSVSFFVFIFSRCPRTTYPLPKKTISYHRFSSKRPRSKQSQSHDTTQLVYWFFFLNPTDSPGSRTQQRFVYTSIGISVSHIVLRRLLAIHTNEIMFVAAARRRHEQYDGFIFR